MTTLRVHLPPDTGRASIAQLQAALRTIGLEISPLRTGPDLDTRPIATRGSGALAATQRSAAIQ